MNSKKRYFPRYAVILFFITLIFACIQIVAVNSESFSDAYNTTFAAGFRFVTARLTGWFSFSLAEILVLLIPAAVIVFVILAVRFFGKPQKLIRLLSFYLSIPMVIYILFVGTYGIGYHGTSLSEKLNLRDEAVSADELYETALWTSSEAAKLESSFTTDENGTVMPYSWQGMTDVLNDAYEKLSLTLPFLQSHRTALKPIMLSDAMTYTGIVGIYSFFTGESNINTTYNDYSTVFTAAHEMAHQRGIAPENEANFIAFLALIQADDEYLRYVGYANMTDYLMSALQKADSSLLNGLYSSFGETALLERNAYNRIYQAHKNQTVRNISSAMNDTYLKSQGTAGSVTYGLVVDLAVAYYASIK